MTTGTAERRFSVRLARLSGATALAFVLASMVIAKPSLAQDVSDMAASVPSDSQMLLEADTLTYDQDNNTVIAAGGVQIEYGGNRLVADKVTYNRGTQRLLATGNVHIIENGGNNIYTDEIDVTDDFREGFVNTLRVETVDKTYFAAESAERKDGAVTTFNNGVYTACEPCEEKPDKAPIWRVKSRKIIWNGQAKTIRFERASFELFGLPIASLPFFEMADPTVKRKSGFLFPSFKFDSETGVGVSVPYYFALSPTYDLTVTGTGYSKQGFLTEAEWRQRFNNGEYNFKIAGIHQLKPYEFDANTVDRGITSPDYGSKGDLNKNRFMAASKGEFKINPRWTFGWDILYQTDKNFSRTYGIGGYAKSVHQSEVFLTGMGDRNYFDLRFMRFQVQEELMDEIRTGGRFDTRIARNDKQPWVLPSFDYSATPDQPIFGGELNIDLNSRTIKRDESDLAVEIHDPKNAFDDEVFAVRGIEGTSHRTTAEAEWKREFVSSFGLVVTPLLHVQGDANFVDMSGASIAAITATQGMADTINAEANIRSEYFRYMATAGLDVRWPVLFSTSSATHVLEPVAQIFARPDERYVGTLGLPNEDAQSLVFDTSSLFERDKFSGYDRIEGGTRANLGVRYSGSFANGWTTNAMFGQSYHLGGLNSYASPDLVNVGAYSGLETDQSDYVGLVGFTTPGGYSGSLSGRFDEKSFEMRRVESKLAYVSTPLSLSAKYAYIDAQPFYGFPEDRHEITISGTKKIRDYWAVFGSGTYDLKSDLLVHNSFGVGYADECFTIALTYSESRKYEYNSTDIDKDQTIGFNISFRTLGDFGTTSSPFGSTSQ